MRNEHARIISVRLRYRRLLFAPKYITFFHSATGKNYYFMFILTTTYNLNKSRPSIVQFVMLLSTDFNGTLFLDIKFGDSEH